MFDDIHLDMSDLLHQAAGWVYKFIPQSIGSVKEIEKIVVHELKEVMPAQGMIFVRLAGLSGAIAVAVGAYGAHGRVTYNYYYCKYIDR